MANLLVRKATGKLFQRYIELMKDCVDSDQNTTDPVSYNNLRWLCNTAIENIFNYPVDKLSRWLGFVQGVLTMRGVISVEEERNFSRPLFHEAYSNEGTDIPPTKNITDENNMINDTNISKYTLPIRTFKLHR